MSAVGLSVFGIFLTSGLDHSNTRHAGALAATLMVLWFARDLPRPEDAGPNLTLWQPPHGGHVGFASGRFPGHVMTMPGQVAEWLGARI